MLGYIRVSAPVVPRFGLVWVGLVGGMGGTPRVKGFLMVVSLRTFWPKCSEMIKGSLWRPFVSISSK